MSNRRLSWLVVGILAVSATAAVLVPRGPFLGLDFQNLDTFHDCVARDNPYLSTGVACGDHLDRGMYYPPLLYWSFVWTRLFQFETAYVLWVAATVVGSVIALASWVPRVRRDGPMLLFVGLLFLQYPMIFALERGNNDVVVLILWSVSAWLLIRQHPAWAGAMAGLSVLLKLYPALAVLTTLAGLFAALPRGRFIDRPLFRYGLGGLLAILVAGLPFVGQLIDYVQLQVPDLIAARSALSPGTHALHFIAPGQQSWVLSLPLLLVWLWAGHRRLGRDPALVLAGGLAISTYFSNLSIDYNLITTYPLLIVLFVRATAAPSNAVSSALLVLGLIAIVGHRGAFLVFGWDAGSLLHIWLQWAWLMVTGVAVAWSRVSLPVVPAAGSAATLHAHEGEAGGLRADDPGRSP